MTALGARASRALEPLGDRLSPILVKEVRQALRGRYFRNLFWFTLCGATLVGILVVSRAVAAGELATAGPNVFVAFAWILAIAVHGFVPLSAFISTSAEWDENTYDLLVLSNLRPRQLVLGKLASTVIQALLFYSAFGPLLVFAFLLHGVDLLSIGVMLGCSVVVSASLSVAAIALSTLARGRFTRIVLLGALAAGLVAITLMTGGMASFLVHMPQMMRSPDFLSGILVFLSCFLALGMISFPVACARLAHEEENVSSGLRVMSLVLLTGGLAWALYLYRTSGDEEHVPGFVLSALVINLVPLLFYATEREPLGRRTRLRVPARRALALAQAPFLPGGGRGILFLALYSALALAGAWLILSFPATASSTKDIAGAKAMVAVGLAYAWIWIGIPAGIGSYFARSLAARSAVR
ncbi:MAG TPA: hypothetical protein VMS76_00035, partial [Planctomycetota bacterium]|nr:hypothetical protein [Planctomycetota bacterium]